MNWFVEKNGKKYGPYNAEQLKQLVNTGKLLPTDLISKEGMAEPVAASKIKGLFKVAQALPSAVVADSVTGATKDRPFADLQSTLHRVCWSTTKRQIVTGFGVLMVLGMIGSATNNKNNPTFGPSAAKSTTIPKSQSSFDGITVSASELIAAYTANELAGDKKFKNKKVIVSGSVREVGTEKVLFGESTFVELFGRDKYDSPRVKCYLPAAQKDRAADLSPGTRTTVQGQCEGLRYGRIVLKDCQFVDRLNLSVSEFVQRARGKSFTYAQFIEQFGLPSSESTPAPISDDLFLYYDLKDGSVMVSLWKASWYKRGDLLIHDVDGL